MPLGNALVDPRLFDQLRRKHFPSFCAIYNEVRQANSIGELIETPADAALIGGQAPIAGMERIPCNISDSKGVRLGITEERLVDVTFTRTLRVVQLCGYFPTITERMRCSVDGVVYNIRGVDQSSVGSHTNLIVEVIS